MPNWTVDAPVSMDFDEVTMLEVRIFGGSVAVLASDEVPSLTVTEVRGRPLQVSQSGGRLAICYEKLSWDRWLDFMSPYQDGAAITLTVPAQCPVQLGVVSAAALVSGLTAGASVKSLSGDITLDGVAGDVTANTVSGELQARDIDGTVKFGSVSGALTLAESVLGSLSAETVSGQVTADVSLDARGLGTRGRAKVSTLSGDVTLRLPAGTDAAVKLTSMSGRVRGDFDTLRSATAPGAHTVSGSVGAGTGRVSVNTVSGAITLLRRPDVSPRETVGANSGTESETR